MRLGSLVAICLLLAGGAVQAQPSNADHLAIQAREVLRRYCVECHGGGPQTRAELNILDLPRLVDPMRRLVMPRSPSTSRLLELIEDGSMPQDIRRKMPDPYRQVLRDWIDAGAPPVMRPHSDAYVLAHILADAKGLGPGDRPYTRYLSLHHLLTETGPQAELDTFRTALFRLVQRLAKPDAPALVALEPTHETVFRLDLRGLGWQMPVLTRNRPPLKPEPLNRFDLVLLEYPYGVLPEASKLTAALGQEYLSLVPQVRALPFVRGDWFVSRALEAVGLPSVNDPTLEQARKLFDAPLGLPAIQAELDWSRPPAELREAFTKPPFAGALAPLGQDGTVSRGAWENSFASVVRTLKLGTPMLPLDGLTWPANQPEPPVAVEISTRAPDGPKKTLFALGELMVIDIESKSSKPVLVEVVWTNAEGKMFVLPTKAGNPLKPGGRVELAPGDKKGWEVSAPTGKDQLILYAFEVDAPEKGDDGFPPGERFSGEGEKDRFVHRFYDGWYDSARKSFDPARVLKKTIVLDIVERGKP